MVQKRIWALLSLEDARVPPGKRMASHLPQSKKARLGASGVRINQEDSWNNWQDRSAGKSASHASLRAEVQSLGHTQWRKPIPEGCPWTSKTTSWYVHLNSHTQNIKHFWNYICVYASTHDCGGGGGWAHTRISVQVPQRSEALGSLEVTGSCEPHYIGTGKQLRSSAREVYAFNLISPARISKYSSDIKRQQKCVHLSDQRSLPEKLEGEQQESTGAR